MHISDPDGLTDEEWVVQAESLNWIRKSEARKK